jgi:NAD(P)-dependent dehydrogenase (short-subunit alcohol dehydrogenase family)
MNELDFQGRVAIVTGSGQGMGRAHAKMLAGRGARVVVNDINAEGAQETVEQIIASGGVAVANSNDIVTDAAALVQAAVDTYGQLDIVVNNAGINAIGRFWEMDADTWWRVFDVSIKGVVEVSRAAMPQLIASGTGRLINISSNALMGSPQSSAYAAAKAAIWGLGNSLAEEAREVGVQVTTLLPVAWTPMTESFFDSPAIQTVLREQFRASDVSAFVTWLAHQDTTVYGGAFEIGGIGAAKTAFAVGPRLKAANATPEAWAAQAETLPEGGELTPLDDASASIRQQLTFLAPELADELHAAAAGASKN